MSGEPDKIAFDTASKPTASNCVEFTEIAKMAASADTMDGFLRDTRKRFLDATAWAPRRENDPATTGSRAAGGPMALDSGHGS